MRRATWPVLLMIVLAGCSRGAGAPKDKLVGAPATAQYAAAQSSDLPKGMSRCEYSAPIDDYIANIVKMGAKSDAVTGTWKQLQDAGAVEGYVAVYAEAPDACRSWVVNNAPDSRPTASRIVSTFVVRFRDAPAAEAAFRADIFKQSQLKNAQGLRVLIGQATGLGPYAAVGADESSVPTAHQAVWQKVSFIVLFNGRNLTRAEFEAATSAENRRAGQ
jgi:hypothetical protein